MAAVLPASALLPPPLPLVVAPPLFSPEMSKIPPDQKGHVEGVGVERAKELFSLPFGFSLGQLFLDVGKAVERVGGGVDGYDFKGGVVDHILDGADLPTSDLDLSIKIDEETGATFYQRATWERLKELLFDLLKERGIEKEQLKNCYLHFDESKQEHSLLLSFPVKGPLKSIDLHLVFKQKISSLTSYDAIQIDVKPLLDPARRMDQKVLLAKSVGAYKFDKVMELRQAGYFEVLPSARIIRKGFLDLPRKLLRGIKPVSIGILIGTWSGFIEQYGREGEGIFGGFDDELRRYLIDHYGDDPLRALAYLLNLDSLICYLCRSEKQREALRAILSTHAHLLMKQKVPMEKEALLFSLREIEMNWLSSARICQAPFRDNFLSDPNFNPFLFEVTLPSNKKCFLYHSLVSVNERPKPRAPQTQLGQFVLPLLFPHSFPLLAPEEKEAAVVPLVKAAKESIVDGTTFKDFLSLFPAVDISRLSEREQEEAGEHLMVLYHLDHGGFPWLKPSDLTLLESIQLAFIRIFCEQNRSLNCRKIASKLISLFARSLDSAQVYPFAKELIIRLASTKKEEEELFALQFYNRFFTLNPNLALALEVVPLLFAASSFQRKSGAKEMMDQLMEPFRNSAQLRNFFFEKKEEMFGLPFPLFFEFFVAVLPHIKRVNEKEEEMILATLNRLEFEREKRVLPRPLLEDLSRRVGERRPKIKEAVDILLGKRKKESEELEPLPASPPKKIGNINELVEEYRAKIRQIDFTDHAHFDRYSGLTEHFNREALTFLLSCLIGENPQGMDLIFALIDQFYISEKERIRALPREKKSFLLEKWMNHFIEHHQKFCLTALSNFSDKKKKEELLIKHHQELLVSLGKKEMSLFSVLERWVIFFKTCFTSSISDSALLRRLYLSYEETFAQAYRGEPSLDEALLFLDEQMLTHAVHFFMKNSEKVELQETLFYLEKSIDQAIRVSSHLGCQYFDYGSSIFVRACEAGEKVERESLYLLRVLLGKSHPEEARKWHARFGVEKGARLYHLGLDLCQKSKGRAPEESLQTLEMVNQFANTFPQFVTPALPEKERDKLITPQIFLALIKTAQNLLHQGKVLDALEMIQKLITTDMSEPLLFYVRAEIYEKMGNYCYAVNSYLQAFGAYLRIADEEERDRRLAPCAFSIASLSYRANDLRMGDNHLFNLLSLARKKVKEVTPLQFSELFKLRGKSLCDQGYWKEACDSYQQAITFNGENRVLLFDLAETLSRAGRKKEATAIYLKVIEFNLEKEKPYLALAEFYLKMGERDKAYDICRRAERKMKKEGSTSDQFFALSCTIVKIYLLKKEYISALHEMRKLSELDFLQLQGLWENEWRVQFDSENVGRELLARVEKAKDDIEALRLLQITYRLQREWVKAIQVSETLFALNCRSGRGQLIITLASLYSNLGDWPRAIEWYEKLVSTGRRDILEKLFDLYMKTGQKEKALALKKS